MLVILEAQNFGSVFVGFLQLFEEALVGQVERLGVLPGVMEDLINAGGDVFVPFMTTLAGGLLPTT